MDGRFCTGKKDMCPIYSFFWEGTSIFERGRHTDHSILLTFSIKAGVHNISPTPNLGEVVVGRAICKRRTLFSRNWRMGKGRSGGQLVGERRRRRRLKRGKRERFFILYAHALENWETVVVVCYR